MDARDILLDTFGRIREAYVDLADGLEGAQAHLRPGGTGNSITWLLWHTARVQDDHVAGLAGVTQEVDAVRVERLDELVDYHDAVHRLTLEYLGRTDAGELDRIVDHSWDPPVTAGVRLVSLLGDCLMHLGQAGYVKGLPPSGA